MAFTQGPQGYGTYQAPGPDIFGISYRGGFTPAPSTGQQNAPEPGTQLVQPPPAPGAPGAFDQEPNALPDFTGGGGLPDFPQPGGGFEGTGVGELREGLPTGAAFSNILQSTGALGAAGVGGGAAAPKNESGKGAGGVPGTPTLTSGAAGGGARGAAGGAATGGKLTPEQQNLVFQKLWQMLMGGGAPGYTPAAVPDFRQEAMQQAELMRKRQGLVQANEAAATGGAGSRDLAFRQSLLDEALLNAGGAIGGEQAGRQFQANLQAKTLEAQQNQARFRDVMTMLQSLGSFTQGGA